MRRAEPRIHAKTTGAALIVCALGCSLALDFDRKQLPPGDVGRDVPLGDGPSADGTNPLPDAAAVDVVEGCDACVSGATCVNNRCACAAGLRACATACRECCAHADCAGGRCCAGVCCRGAACDPRCSP